MSVRENAEAIDLRYGNACVVILKTPQAEHLLISNGCHAIQLHIIDGTVLNGPVQLPMSSPKRKPSMQASRPWND